MYTVDENVRVIIIAINIDPECKNTNTALWFKSVIFLLLHCITIVLNSNNPSLYRWTVPIHHYNRCI